MNPISLGELKPGQQCVSLFTITVKVLKLWTTHDHNKVANGLEAILVDNEGVVIAASASKRMVKYLLTRLKEGSTVKMSKFDIVDNGIPRYQRARINHAGKLMLIYGTQVVECRPDLSILTNGINLMPYREIGNVDPTFFVDVIGQVVARGNIECVGERNARKLDIDLRDDRYNSHYAVLVVLWEAYADKLLEHLPEDGLPEEGMIIVLQFVIVAKFQSEVKIQTAMHATKMYINVVLPEVDEFKIKKKDNGSASVTFLSADPRSLRPEEWLNMESHRTPTQIKEMTTIGSHIMFATLIKVDENAPWFYMSCSNCNGNARKLNVGESCTSTKCAGQAIEKLIPKFRVKFTARGLYDENIVVVLFEEAVKELIQRSCHEVYIDWEKEADDDMIPMDFCDMLHRDYLLKVRVTDYNLKGDKFKEFSVDVLTENPAILTQYAALTKGEEISGQRGAIQINAKGKDKAADEVLEAASNDVEGFITPRKRLSMADSEDDATPSAFGTNKSTNKVALKMVKKEKPDKP